MRKKIKIKNKKTITSEERHWVTMVVLLCLNFFSKLCYFKKDDDKSERLSLPTLGTVALPSQHLAASPHFPSTWENVSSHHLHPGFDLSLQATFQDHRLPEGH